MGHFSGYEVGQLHPARSWHAFLLKGNRGAYSGWLVGRTQIQEDLMHLGHLGRVVGMNGDPDVDVSGRLGLPQEAKLTRVLPVTQGATQTTKLNSESA